MERVGEGLVFFTKYERYNLVKDLLYDGFAVFALDANEQTMGDQNGDGNIRWNSFNPANANADNNVDIKNIKALKDSVINEFNFSDDIPCFNLGMSAGAVFSDLCAFALGFNASAHLTAKGKLLTYQRSDIVPVIWIMSENDHNPGANNKTAFEHFTEMDKDHIAEWHYFKRSPAYPQRFIRSLNNISDKQSEELFGRLQTEGYLAADNSLRYLSLDSIPTTILNNMGLSLTQKVDISQQLLCINADHVLHSDYNKNIIRFFNQNLISTGLPENEFKNIKTSIYPNPMHNFATIEFDNTEEEIYTLELFNVLGQKVKSIGNISGDKANLQRENLPDGIYFYHLQSKRKTYAAGQLVLE